MKAGWFLWIDKEKEKIRMSTEYQTIEEFDKKWGGRPYPHKWNVELFEFQNVDAMMMAYKGLTSFEPPNDYPIENEVDGSEEWMLKKIKELDEHFEGDMISSELKEAWYHGAKGWMTTQAAKIVIMEKALEQVKLNQDEIVKALDKIIKKVD